MPQVLARIEQGPRDLVLGDRRIKARIADSHRVIRWVEREAALQAFVKLPFHPCLTATKADELLVRVHAAAATAIN